MSFPRRTSLVPIVFGLVGTLLVLTGLGMSGMRMGLFRAQAIPDKIQGFGDTLGWCCSYYKEGTDEQNYGTPNASCGQKQSYTECNGLYFAPDVVFIDPLDGGQYTPYDACKYACVSMRSLTTGGPTAGPKPGGPIPPHCGNGVVQEEEFEECDDGISGNANEPNKCRTNCVLPDCGDGITDYGALYNEQCDLGDENGAEGSTCSIDCKSLLSGTKPPSTRPYPPGTPVWCCKPNDFSDGVTDQQRANWRDDLTYDSCVDSGEIGIAAGVVAGLATGPSPGEFGVQCSQQLPNSCGVCDACGNGGIFSQGRCTRERCEGLLGYDEENPSKCTFKYGFAWGILGANTCLPNPENTMCGGNMCDVCSNKRDAASCNAVGGGKYCQYFTGTWWKLRLDAGCSMAGKCARQVWVPVRDGACVQRAVSDTQSIGFSTQQECIQKSVLGDFLSGTSG